MKPKEIDTNYFSDYSKKNEIVTAWKVSEYAVISGSYFPVSSPNSGKYGPEITSYLNTFHAVSKD